MPTEVVTVTSTVPEPAGDLAVQVVVVEQTTLGLLEAPHLGKDDGVMPQEKIPGRPSTRRYTPAEKEQAVRLVRKLRAELGTDHGTVGRVARQLGYGEESVRGWVRQADIDGGEKPGVTTDHAERMKNLEQENRELRGPTRSCAEHRLSLRRSSTARSAERAVHRREP